MGKTSANEAVREAWEKVPGHGCKGRLREVLEDHPHLFSVKLDGISPWISAVIGHTNRHTEIDSSHCVQSFQSRSPKGRTRQDHVRMFEEALQEEEQRMRSQERRLAVKDC